METIIKLADRLVKAEQLLSEYVETDECICEDVGAERENWMCLFCQAHEFLADS